ncbi:peptidyl-prolyl cis-trans isomerase [Tropicibacter sp. Alg240-R139]|uniref:peptidylprolyl isomerase n=1 Tax=Tropicibacter sp. Alg240-R139 TaxID=2305991 RepID=UPI0013E0DF06|nr:peptidylprolyl isomerase [Tropicibacter sp. Alg240-R139]
MNTIDRNTMQEHVGPAQSMVARVLREPLVHFLALAGLLFVMQALFATDQRDLIVVDTQTQKFLFDQEEELQLRPLTDAEKTDIVDGFIEEEILVREAVKRGFSDSSRIRALLLQNMRFFIAGDLREPTEADLREFFAANSDKFESPPSFDLDHVMFKASGEVPQGLLNDLNTGSDPAGFGEVDMSFGRVLRYMDQRRLVQALGGETARQALEALSKDRNWHGPFVSPTGSVHFLRVIKTNPPQLPDFDRARDWISAQWLADKSRQLLETELQSVRQDYQVEVERLDGTDNGA